MPYSSGAHVGVFSRAFGSIRISWCRVFPSLLVGRRGGGGQILEAFLQSGWPGEFDTICFDGAAQPEVEAEIILRIIA